MSGQKLLAFLFVLAALAIIIISSCSHDQPMSPDPKDQPGLQAEKSTAKGRDSSSKTGDEEGLDTSNIEELERAVLNECKRVGGEIRALDQQCLCESDFAARIQIKDQIFPLLGEYQACPYEPIVTADDVCAGIQYPNDTDSQYRIAVECSDIPPCSNGTVELTKGFDWPFEAWIIGPRCTSCDPDDGYACTGVWVQEDKLEGDLEWISLDPNIVTVTPTDSNMATVSAVSAGSTTIVVYSTDWPELVANVPIKVTSGVDIVLVAQTEGWTVQWMGFENWACDGNMCVEPEDWWTDTSFTSWTYYGTGGYPGDVFPAVVRFEPCGLIGLSLTDGGPYVDEPLQVNLTVQNNGGAKSPKVYLKAIGVGTAQELWCPEFMYGFCDPGEPSQWFLKRTWVVEPMAYELDELPPGLRELGPEVVAALSTRFDDYRFGLTGFGRYPSTAVCDYDNEPPWWMPYVEPTPFYDWISLTSSASVISDGLTNLRLICSMPTDLNHYGTCTYSAAIHAIQNNNWRENAKKVVLLFSYLAVCRPIDGEAEYVSGYTPEDVISAANDECVTIVTLCASSWNLDVIEPFQAMANSTGGHFINAVETWPMLNTLEVAFDAIKALTENQKIAHWDDMRSKERYKVPPPMRHRGYGQPNASRSEMRRKIPLK